MSAIVVRKYGGSSLAALDQVRGIADEVATVHVAAGPLVVVVSARGGATDDLLALVGELGGTRTERETDQLLATGETASAALMALALRARGVPAMSMTGEQAGIQVVGKHGEGVISHVMADQVLRRLGQGRTVVVAGFQGANGEGDTITLGRDGSDTTAVALAAELRAVRCEIYTDVDGVHTADPRVVPDARVLPSVGAGLMAEMAFAGARILHSRAVELAAMCGVEVHVRNSATHRPGTVIVGGGDSMLETRGVVVAITHDRDVARVLVRATGGRSDLAADVLSRLAHNSVPVDLVARSGPYESEFRMGFTVRRSDLPDVRASLERYVTDLGGQVSADEEVGKLSLIGIGLLNRPQYTARLLSTLAVAGIPTSWISTSQLRTSVVIPLGRLTEAVALLHREFQLENAEPGVDSLAPA